MKNLRAVLFIFFFFCWAGIVTAQKIKVSPTGLHYCFYKKYKHHRQAKSGDIIFYQLVLKNSKDSLVLNTRMEFGEQQIAVTSSSFKGDLMEALLMMHSGDSALFLIPVDSLYKNALPYFAQPHSMMKFYLKANNIFSENELSIYQNIMKQKSLDYDDSLLHIYLNKNFCVPTKLASGVYVYHKGKIKPSSQMVQSGDTIAVNYTGKLINNYIFDSNIEKRFNHLEPFKFVVGKGEVIKGWDEAFKTLYYGEKATLFIPSIYAYGKKQVGTIPSNSILIFDVEVLKK